MRRIASVLVLAYLCASNAFCATYKHLEKSDIKAFKIAYNDVSIAYEKKDFRIINAFGPNLLRKYETILIQTDKYVVKAKPLYVRLDSIVAYSIYRIRLDSMEHTAATSEGEGRIMLLDKTLNALKNIPIIQKMDPEYFKTRSAHLTSSLEKEITLFYNAADKGGRQAEALRLLSGLYFKSPIVKEHTDDLSEELDEIFYNAMASNDTGMIKSFIRQNPHYRSMEINERLNSITADIITILIDKGEIEPMVNFVHQNPDSPYLPMVHKRLEPSLFKSCLNNPTIENLSLYLSLYMPDTPNGLRVSALLKTSRSPGYGEVPATRQTEGMLKRRITDAEYAGSDVIEPGDSPCVQGEDGLIPDSAMRKMVELGMIECGTEK